MGQWLRTFAALQKDLGWVPNTHDRQLTITCNSTSRDSTPSSVLCTYLHSHVHISQTKTIYHLQFFIYSRYVQIYVCTEFIIILYNIL